MNQNPHRAVRPKPGEALYVPKDGDVLYVRAKGGLPNGRRSRAGFLFTDDADIKLTVGDNVDAGKAKLIVADDGLVVSPTSRTSEVDALRQELAEVRAKLAQKEGAR